MAYILYSIIFLTLTCATALYFTQARWIPLLTEVRLPDFPGRDYIYCQRP